MCQPISSQDSHTATEYGPYVQKQKGQYRQETVTKGCGGDKDIRLAWCQIGQKIQSGTINDQYDQDWQTIV
tara:strand:+ start:2438 stop:2650 length:213 start_codon:yes stop_codon:yes gene_type:complete